MIRGGRYTGDSVEVGVMKHVHEFGDVRDVVDEFLVLVVGPQPLVNLEPLVLHPLLCCFMHLLARSEPAEAVIRSPVKHFIILLVH